MYQKWINMSRTLKDRPYWVKLNESTKTDHDHINLGRTYYTNEPVLDKDGNKIYDTVDWMLPAWEVVARFATPVFDTDRSVPMIRSYGQFFTQNWEASRQIERIHRNVYTKAHELCSANRRSEMVSCGTYQSLRVNRVLYRQVLDYCTEGEKYTSRDDYDYRVSRRSEKPCTPSWDGLSEAAGKGIYTSDMADIKTSTRREINGIIRRTERDTLNEVKNAWNSGYDVDDYDQDVDFTTSQPHKWAYWLY